jgi:hypothetical protein
MEAMKFRRFLACLVITGLLAGALALSGCATAGNNQQTPKGGMTGTQN